MRWRDRLAGTGTYAWGGSLARYQFEQAKTWDGCGNQRSRPSAPVFVVKRDLQTIRSHQIEYLKSTVTDTSAKSTWPVGNITVWLSGHDTVADWPDGTGPISPEGSRTSVDVIDLPGDTLNLFISQYDIVSRKPKTLLFEIVNCVSIGSDSLSDSALEMWILGRRS